jgi:hypothetical protein
MRAAASASTWSYNGNVYRPTSAYNDAQEDDEDDEDDEDGMHQFVAYAILWLDDDDPSRGLSNAEIASALVPTSRQPFVREDVCPICHETLSSDAAVTDTPDPLVDHAITATLDSASSSLRVRDIQLSRVRVCNHAYCTECIGTWLRRACSCPVCKADVRGVQSSSSSRPQPSPASGHIRWATPPPPEDDDDVADAALWEHALAPGASGEPFASASASASSS